MGLQNHIKSEAEKYNSLLHASFELIFAVTDERAFSTANHIRVVKEETWDRKKYRNVANDVKPRVIVRDQGAFKKRLFVGTNHMGSWMVVRGATVTSTVLAAT